MTVFSRRGALTRAFAAASILMVPLTGCGFRPLYGGAGQAALTGIYVDIIPDRRGQELRQALQVRLDGSTTPAPGQYRYELAIAYTLAAEGLGVQTDNSSTRTRFIGHAKWVLRRIGVGGKTVTSGTASAVDGVNVINEQFFYGDLSAQAVERRMADMLADQIAQSIAAYLRTAETGTGADRSG